MTKWEQIDRSRDRGELLLLHISKWNFKKALNHLDGQPENVQVAVKALANSFENCGYMYGAVGDVISCLVLALLEGRPKKLESVTAIPTTPSSPPTRGAVAMAGGEE